MEDKTSTPEQCPDLTQEQVVASFIDRILHDVSNEPEQENYQLENKGIKSLERAYRKSKSAAISLPPAYRELKPAAMETIRVEILRSLNGNLFPAGIFLTEASTYRVQVSGVEEPMYVNTNKLKRLLLENIVDAEFVTSDIGTRIIAVMKVGRQLLLDNCE